MELQTVLVSATVAGKFCYVFYRPIPFTFVNEDLPAAVTAELSNTDVVSVWVMNVGPQAILVRVENTLGILTIESEIEVQPNKDSKFALQYGMRMTVSEAPLQTEFTHIRFVRLSAQRWRCETIKDSIPLGEAKFFHKDWCFSSYTSTDWNLDGLKDVESFILQLNRLCRIDSKSDDRAAKIVNGFKELSQRLSKDARELS